MADTIEVRNSKAKLLNDGVWLCSICGEVKALDNFYKNPSKNWPNSQCRDCWNEKQRSGGRDAALKYLYSLESGEYERMVEEQGGRCAICKKHQDDLDRVLYVDHDHACCFGKRSCGKCVRGLLCARCNLILGKFNDDIDMFSSAVLYLKKNRVK